ncbi:MAG: SMC-Scp complex subunit ScpB [Alphaproteobacteria bacterium]|nr:SMC-Scp complex subunit ScpB [Alphaproteobacteria bacterium]
MTDARTPPSDPAAQLRIVEALLFAAAEPLDRETLAASLPKDADIDGLIAQLADSYAGRGVNLVRVAGRWQFRTAPDLAWLLERHRVAERRLSRAAVETLAVIAYHQPVTRADVESLRGVVTSRGTLDVLLETGWVTIAGRRDTPGRPVLYATTDVFLTHFGLADLKDLPGLAELKGSGLLQLPNAASWGAPLAEEKLPEPPAEDDAIEPPLPLDEPDSRS